MKIPHYQLLDVDVEACEITVIFLKSFRIVRYKNCKRLGYFDSIRPCISSLAKRLWQDYFNGKKYPRPGLVIFY